MAERPSAVQDPCFPPKRPLSLLLSPSPSLLLLLFPASPLFFFSSTEGFLVAVRPTTRLSYSLTRLFLLLFEVLVSPPVKYLSCLCTGPLVPVQSQNFLHQTKAPKQAWRLNTCTLRHPASCSSPSRLPQQASTLQLHTTSLRCSFPSTPPGTASLTL